MIFQFKQFAVRQQKSAAKITTDATIFAAELSASAAHRGFLEIGTGTGVLTLMLAQRFDQANIDAVEIEENAFQEAQSNFTNSPFADRLNIHHSAIQQFYPEDKYDVIFSNPPFFNNNLQSAINPDKNTAYHTNSLSFYELATSIERLLKEDGEASVMLPVYESELFEKEMTKIAFFVKEIIFIKHNENKAPLRKILKFVRAAIKNPQTKTVTVRNADNSFSDDYRSLMTPFLTIF
ncbi:methyltransferase [Marivirga atlantica]|jgi:tRNA1Val (adenine37-N6)-methyltransferase|uniref:tRNA1(Val) (adenine(37)-N6)-methyltransferase n=1 Tax=Marivirga atlantica TaxID=1548457 RepID=A0A937DKQ4_9BACT|nr:methyltransferase [Marivirga atlantica]MBL0766476.1 methyltransferase [Marivirga atlantica]